MGEQVLILSPDSTANKVYSCWKGPATIVEVRLPYSYLVELDGTRSHVHANKLRKFHVRIDEVVLEPSVEDLLPDQTVSVETCAVIYEHDLDFGPVNVVDSTVQKPDRSSELLPSQKIDPAKVAHLSA